jgi:CDP-4-dehydro-6-deoxyglucose reductase/ferredoxin-NAD(P)+ reductase (naphthalene dioxygenase ferredoxin-specific)
MITRDFEITIEDLDRKITAQPGATLLAALLSQGVPFPYSCESGNCGACKCQLVRGEVSGLEYSEQALSSQERSKGVILACRSRVHSDLTVRRLPPPRV